MTQLTYTQSFGVKRFRVFRSTAVAFLALVGVEGLGDVMGGSGVARAETRMVENLEVGYSLLEASLGDESGLKWLLLVRKLTLNKPPADVATLMERISKTSKKRAAEIKNLRKLQPDVSADPPPSPVGDAIQASAKDMGMHEMIFPHGAFNIRFLFLQAQATRMIAVIAAETAKLDPNDDRKKWLRDLSKEYEGMRDEIVESVKHCSPS